MIVLTIKNWVLAVSILAYVVVVAIIVTLLLVLDKHGRSGGASTCQCPNGTPATTCSSPNESRCVKCDVGYHLDENNQCQQNICNCSNGTAATGSDCTEDKSTKCVSCKHNYNLVDNQCQLGCQCPNGTPTTTCTTNPSCDSCTDPNYHVNNNGACVQNVCKCTNGTPVTSDKCETTGEEKCASCNSGYDLNKDNVCVVQCTEYPGQTYTDWPTQGSSIMGCSYCPNHYYVSDKGTPCTTYEVAKDPSTYQSMCKSYDTMVGKQGAFEIVELGGAGECSGKDGWECVRTFPGQNKDAVGWVDAGSGAGDNCPAGKCFYADSKNKKAYCMYACYSQYNPSLSPKSTSCNPPST